MRKFLADIIANFVIGFIQGFGVMAVVYAVLKWFGKI